MRRPSLLAAAVRLGGKGLCEMRREEVDVKRTREVASRRLAVVPVALALAVAACGKDSTDRGGESSRTGKALSGTLNASGATFPLPFYEEAIDRFTERNPDVTISYAGSGSAKGRTDLQNRLVDFAGSDGLIKPEDLSKFPGKVLFFPTVAGPITISYNLADVKTLKLTPELVAKIFSRQIKTWNDPAVKAANPDAELPATAITVARRSDGSGTTENLTKYLVAAAGSAWALGSGSTIAWPGDTRGGQGNAGVATIVKQTAGGIGYVDLSDAKAAGLQTAEVQNKAGKLVAPTPAAASAALKGAKINDDLTYNPLNADGDEAYPITAPTWILTYDTQADEAKTDILKAFLEFVVTDGQDLAARLDYAHLPDELATKAVHHIDKIKVGP
jgi:phosphate transport system substrate-binding protein